MPYSCIVERKVLDYHYKRLSSFSYAFYIGDIYVGQVFNMGNSWSAVSKTPTKLGSIDGFVSRFYACQYLLKVEGYIKKESIQPNPIPRIYSPVIRYKGIMYHGRSHSEIGLRMVEEGQCSIPYPSSEDYQGFVTETGKYVTREEALIIAINAGQVVKGKTIHNKKLFSEDLINKADKNEGM